MAQIVFRGRDGREERHETTEATAAATVARYAGSANPVRAFAVGGDGAEREVFAVPARMVDAHADLRVGRRR